MADFDIRRLLREIAARHGIRMNIDDPALTIVTLNRLLLDEAFQVFGNQVRDATDRIAKTGEKVQERAGSILAQEVRLCASAVRQELHDDIDLANQHAQKIVMDLHRAYSKTSLFRCLPAGLICAVILLGCGFWMGWTAH